jgi:hypothetical protein
MHEAEGLHRDAQAEDHPESSTSSNGKYKSAKVLSDVVSVRYPERPSHHQVLGKRLMLRRECRTLISIEVPVHVLRALERLALLEPDNRDKHAVAAAVERFLEALPGFVSMGDAVWPEQGDA